MMASDADIVETIRRDRDKGARLLVREYRVRLEALAKGFGADPHQAEDLVFRTFERAIEKIDTCQSPEAFYTWLCSILRNFHLQAVRTQAFKRMVLTDTVPDVAESASPAFGADIDAERLRQGIDALPKEMREVILMHYFMEIPVARMAKILLIPEGTVKSRLHYARLCLSGLVETPRGKRIVRGLAILLVAVSLLFGLHAAWPNGASGRTDVWLGDNLQMVSPGRRLGEVKGLDLQLYVCSPQPIERHLRLDVINDGAVAFAPCTIETPEGTYSAQLLLVQIGDDIWGRATSPRRANSVVPLVADKPDTADALAVRLTGLNYLSHPPEWRMKASFAAALIPGDER